MDPMSTYRKANCPGFAASTATTMPSESCSRRTPAGPKRREIKENDEGSELRISRSSEKTPSTTIGFLGPLDGLAHQVVDLLPLGLQPLDPTIAPSLIRVASIGAREEIGFST